MNVMNYGLNFYYAGFGYFPILMLARLVSNPNQWICRPVEEQPLVAGFEYPFGGSQLQFAFTLPKLAPHFPYGYEVEPDHP